MRVRTTLRSLFIFFISIAAMVCIILPFLTTTLGGVEKSTPFYDLLKFEKVIYPVPGEANDLLNTLREVASYLTIAVLAAGAFAFIMSLVRIIFYKNKFLGFLCGISNLLLMLSSLGLGVLSVVHMFIYQSALKELGMLIDGVAISSLGSWIYSAIGGLVPIVIVTTNFIPK